MHGPTALSARMPASVAMRGSAFQGARFGDFGDFAQFPNIVFTFPGQGGEVFQFPFPVVTPEGWVFPPYPQPQPGPQPQPQPQPQPEPPTADGWPAAWVAFEDDVLRQTNEARARGAVCGGVTMAPTGALTTNRALRAAARGHSKAMGDQDFFAHDDPQGRGPGDRAKAAGYPSSFVGENIAAGQKDPAAVVRAWLESPGHCKNIMEPGYRYLGVGYAHDAAGVRYGHYWTQEFGG